ncbi:hypothetical protein K492DRAFT_191797 [Lichtheimia hyalospora FSU 10163]|nr:hypothetical protein K492DRAFT_191797 [Lichtheimia hyalospora FSU 10163]
MTTPTNTTFANGDGKIQRPTNCFLEFRLENENEIAAGNPGASHREISKIIAKSWKELPEEEKELYRQHDKDPSEKNG